MGKEDFFKTDRLVRYHRLKKWQALFWRMLLRVSLDKKREEEKEWKKIDEITLIWPISSIEKEYNIWHKAIKQIMSKLDRKICTYTEHWHGAKAIIITKEEIDSIHDLFEYWTKYMKFKKSHRQIIYYVILYILRLSA